MLINNFKFDINEKDLLDKLSEYGSIFRLECIENDPIFKRHVFV